MVNNLGREHKIACYRVGMMQRDKYTINAMLLLYDGTVVNKVKDTD